MGKRNLEVLNYLNKLENIVAKVKSGISDFNIKDFEELIGEMKGQLVRMEVNSDRIAVKIGQRDRLDQHFKILDDLPMGYVEVNESLSIQFVNRLFTSIFPIDSQDFVGKVITSFIDPDFQEQFLHLIKRVKNQRSKSSIIVKLNSEKDNYSKLECNIDQNGDQLTFRIAFIDVTREVINEQQLIESRERYKAVADYAYHWEYWLDPTGQLLYMSPSCERITGYSKFDFFDNHNLLDNIIHPEDKQAFITHQSLSKTNSEPSTERKLDFRIKRKDGEVRWLNHVCINIFRDDGKHLGIRVTNKDITEQKEFETALKLSEQKLLESNNRVSAILETLPDLIFIISNDGVYLDFYASKESLLFVKPDVFIGRSIRDILPSELAEKNEKALKRVFKTGEQQYITYSLEQDNEIKYFEVRIVKYTHDSALAIVRDISTQKRGEQIIARNELYLKTILQTSVDGFWIVGLDGKFLEVNQSYCKMSGYTREEILNLCIHDIDVLEDVNQVYRHVRNVVNSGSEIFETKHRRKDGTIFDVEVSVTYLKFNNEQIICFIRDISERKKAELELLSSHKSILFLADKALSFVKIRKLNDFYDFIGESVHEMYPDAFLMVNSVNIEESYLVTERVYGEKALIKKLIDLLGYNLIGKRHTIQTSFLKSGDGKLMKVEGGIYEFTLGNAPKRIVPLIEKLLDVNTIYGIAVLVDNQIVCSVGMVFPRGSDIDKVHTLEALIKQASIAYNRIIAEENLLKEQNRFILSMEATNDGLWDWNVITDQTYFSPAYFTMLGFEVGGFPSSGETWEKMIHPEDVDDTLKIVQNSINGAGDSFEVEFRMKTAEDGWKWILGRGKVIERNKKGKATRVVGTHMDITERKIFEETLSKRNRFIQTVLDNLPIGLALIDRDRGTTTYINKKFVEIYGWDEEVIKDIPKFIESVYPDKEYRDKLTAQISADIKSGDPLRMRWKNLKVTQRDNSIRFIDAANIPLFDQNIMVSTVIDVTEQKEFEQALRESESRFKALHNASFGGIVIHDKGLILDCNKGLSEITGFSQEELVGMNGLLLIAEETREMVLSNILAGYEKPYEAMGVRKDGSKYPLSLEARNIPYKGKQVRVVEFRDITEAKNAEQALRNSEKRFRMLAELAPVGIIITDEYQNPAYVSPTFTKIFGYTKKDIPTAEHWFKLAYPDESARNELIKEWIEYTNLAKNERGDLYPMEQSVYCLDGSYKQIEFRLAVSGDIHVIAFTDVTERKLAEQALRESEERISSIFRVAPIGIGVVVNRVLTEVNQTICDIIGYSKEELIGKSAQILYPTKEEFEKVGKEKYRQISEKGTGTVETKWKRKDGSIINILLSSTPIAQNDLLQGVTFTALDITERKQNERLMKGRLKLLEFADTSSLPELLKETLAVAEDLTGSQIGFYHFIDEAKGEIILNQWSERTEKELCKLTKDFENHYPIEKAGVWVECIKRRKPVIHNDYDSLTNKKGMPEGHASLIRELTVPVIRNKSIVAVLGIGNKATNYTKTDIEIIAQLADMAWDIVERKMAQEQVHKLSISVEQSPVMVIITNKQGAIEYVNPKFSEVTGYTLNEVMGQNPRILNSGNQSKAFYQNLWDTILSGNDWQGDMLNLKKNGEFYWESAFISPIKDKRGEIKHFIAIKEDITERKRAEEALIQSEYILKEKNEEYLALNEELTESNQRIIKINQDLIAAREKAEESDKLKTAFLANMSHEIRTPMNAIIGFSEMLLNPSIEKEKRTFFTQILNTSCHQLLSVVEDVIDIAKIETGQMDVVLSKTNLNHAISRVQSIFLPQTLQREVEILASFSLPDDLAYIQTDTNKLNQILTNLVSNALKFTEKGSIHISYRVENDYVEFCVKDTGIGIKQEYHEVIFERFRQVELESTRKYGGTGLGLPISKAFVEALGGRIWVHSNFGKGSSFFFTLPFKGFVENNVEKVGSIIPHVSLKGKVVLVAEDEEANFILISEILEDAGAEVIRAENGKMAIDIFQSSPKVDLILMDIKMPEMNGIEATKRIKEIDKNIPIIALTAYAFSDDRERCIAAGCSEYLSKPVTKNELLSILSTYIA